jgi:hypothetical protein
MIVYKTSVVWYNFAIEVGFHIISGDNYLLPYKIFSTNSVIFDIYQETL